jgi:hypothetical protein
MTLARILSSCTILFFFNTCFSDWAVKGLCNCGISRRAWRYEWDAHVQTAHGGHGVDMMGRQDAYMA